MSIPAVAQPVAAAPGQRTSSLRRTRPEIGQATTAAGSRQDIDRVVQGLAEFAVDCVLLVSNQGKQDGQVEYLRWVWGAVKPDVDPDNDIAPFLAHSGFDRTMSGPDNAFPSYHWEYHAVAGGPADILIDIPAGGFPRDALPGSAYELIIELRGSGEV